MSKHVDSVPKLAEFRPPWITEDGNEVEINKDTLKKFLHNLITDKAKALDSRDELKESLATVTAERDDFKSQVDSKDPDSAGKIAKLEQKVKDAEAKLAKSEIATARAEIASEKGLTAKQAKRLQGETREELEADADELLEDLGITPGNEKDDDDEDDDEPTVRTTPQTRRTLTNGGDSKNGADIEPDYDKIAAEISGPRFI
jgi:hypothetical protein